MAIITRDEVEKLIRLSRVAEGSRWFLGKPGGIPYSCPFCVDANNECHQCLWEKVLEYISLPDPDVCLPTTVEHGYTPRRLLERFLIENNLARPSKIPGEWVVT